MSENHKALMKKYGIQVEASNAYIYKGFRYRTLNDAINYAILKEKEHKVDSADNTQVSKGGDSNFNAE